MVNSNTWNKIRYSIYQPFYDLIANYFRNFRSRSIQSLNLNQDDKILIIGAGTGLDLEFLVGHENITAIDITPSMLSKLERRAKTLDISVKTEVMDGSNLNFDSNTFDAVILHLIIAVIPNPINCLKETERVLKQGGKFTIMDKFVKPGLSPSIIIRLANPLTSLLATHISRDINELISHTTLNKTVHEKLQGIFWLIQGHKNYKD